MWPWEKRWKSMDGVKVILSLSNNNEIPIIKMCGSDEEQAKFVRQWISRFNQQADKGAPLVYKH